MSSARRLVTERLVIATATQQHLLVELDDPSKLEPLLGGRVPEAWPPAGDDEARLRQTMDQLHRGPREIGWWLRYVVLRRGPEGQPVLIGRVGLQGQPVDGEVRVDCQLLPELSDADHAKEATGRLVDWALDHKEVQRVIAEPSVSREGWIRALLELGFEREGDELSDAERGTARLVRRREAWLEDSVALRRGAKLVSPSPDVPIAGLPSIAREVFDRLQGEPLRDPDDVCREVRLYAEMLASAAASDEAVDHELGRDIARTCEGLLLAITDATPEHTRRQIQAAARYFVTEEDGDSDLEIGGLDEDAAVANAVAEHLGRSDLVADLD